MKRLKNPFYNRDIVSIKDFQRPDLDYLFHVANEIKTGLIASPQGENQDEPNEDPDINIGDE